MKAKEKLMKKIKRKSPIFNRYWKIEWSYRNKSFRNKKN